MASNLDQRHEDDAWQMRKSVLECNEHMLENQIRCDLTFTFGQKNDEASTVYCHSYMLISRSPVFYAMLAGPARDDSGIINIPDIDKETFQQMLRYEVPGLSMWHVRRPGLFNLSPRLALIALNKSHGLAWPYFSFH